MTSSINSLKDLLHDSDFSESFSSWSVTLADLIWQAKLNNKLITFFGNGGSAADSQHWAAELMCTYRNRNRPPIPALALTTDSSVVTAWANDFDYSSVFARQIQALNNINGLSIGMSTSGKSQNVLQALSCAQACGATTVLISGSSVSPLSCDFHVVFPSRDTPTIQTLTQMLYHDVCQHLEDR